MVLAPGIGDGVTFGTGGHEGTRQHESRGLVTIEHSVGTASYLAHLETGKDLIGINVKSNLAGFKNWTMLVVLPVLCIL